MKIRKNHIQLIIVTVLSIFIILIYSSRLINFLVDDTQKMNLGTYDLPGQYVLNKISPHDNIIEHDTDGIVVSENVTNIAYNESYIFYKCSGKDAFYGLINVSTYENKIIYLHDPLLAEIGLNKEMLVDINELYPETHNSN